MLLLYKSTVRPILEYGSPIWMPWKKDKLRLERVQRRFTKMVEGMEGRSYEQRLKALGMTTLDYRRHREQLIQVFKIMSGYYDVDYRAFFEKTRSERTRGHDMKLQTVRARLKARSNFFSVRVVNEWNSLPEDAVHSSSLNQFKNRLERHMRSRQYEIE